MISDIKNNLLSLQDLENLINHNKQFYLIHVLDSEHFKLVHLPGAFNACVYEVTFMDQVEAITGDRNSTIVVYGSSDNSMDSITAAEKLVRAGYNNIHILNGGIEVWQNAGKPLEGSSVKKQIDPCTKLRLDNRDGKYRVDTAKSIIEWTGRNVNSTHTGSVRISDGEIIIINGKVSGKFIIDMKSITNYDLKGDELQPILISHLNSDDFFFTKLFPHATFEILDASPVDEPFLSYPNFEINGTLKLRGLKLDHNFSTTITEVPPDGFSAEAHFDIDRTSWGVIYGSTRFFEHLGMHLVFDLISIQIKIIVSK